MGNCIKITSKHTQSEQIRSHIEEEEKYGAEKKGKKMRVKIVLRKEELEVLMLELKKTGGKRPLEDVLGEIQRIRARARAKSSAAAAAAWRPCLDSIFEDP